MSIPTVCQQCSTSYRLRDDFAGKKVRCRKCGATIAVPAADEAAPVKADEPVAQVATVKAREAATVSAPVVSARQVAPVEASEPVADISPVAEAPQIAAESEGAAENPMDFLAAIAAARPVAATASVQPTASAEPVTVANPTPQVAAAAVQEESPVAVTAAATTGAVAAAEIPQAAGAPDPLELLPVVRPVSPVGADPAAKVQAPVKAEPVAGAPAAAKPAGMSKGVKVLLFVLLGIFVFLFLGAAAIGVAAGYWYSHLGPGIALDVKVTGSADDAGAQKKLVENATKSLKDAGWTVRSVAKSKLTIEVIKLPERPVGRGRPPAPDEFRLSETMNNETHPILTRTQTFTSTDSAADAVMREKWPNAATNLK